MIENTSTASSSSSTALRPVLVYGAAGHTGRFVVQAMREQGHAVLLAGRDIGKLQAAFPDAPSDQLRVAELDDAAALTRLLAESALVVNCAGPFADSAPQLLQAALHASVHYVDVSAEQPTSREVFAQWGERFTAACLCAAPAVAFYGALGDLLATSVLGDWPGADAIELHIALDSWHPTEGTRKTGQRNAGRHVVYANGQFQAPPAVAPRKTWAFAAPFGQQGVVGFSSADAVTIAHHIRVPDVPAWMNETPLTELRAADTPAPVAVDASGRSAQRFLVEVVVRRGNEERRASASGQDIYAITGPLAAQAVGRILGAGGGLTGALSAGQLGDARSFLQALAPGYLQLDFGG
ncbi:saccharopine dehydrogenase NADP-binding domain-containing protein [Acidovorax sp. LjRoot66]|uniref:saccharopine dehydrogenase NADP-binding domain-containing protein n=1 Tax=Acidovorax sp. LjRoot66 TaxID=3342334 RepID=UPI003ECCD03A